MQPNPYYYPNYSHAQWLYAHVPQMPYLPHPWIPQGPAYHHPDVPGHAPQLPGYNPTHSKADRDARKLQQAIQASSQLQNAGYALSLVCIHIQDVT